MKFITSIREHVASHLEDYRLASMVMAGGLLIGLFVLTQPVNMRHHNALMSHFSQLQSDESRLGEAVLRLSFNLANNYDQVTALINNLHTTVGELREGEAASDLRGVDEFEHQLRLLEQRMSLKQEVLERFKSRNAVLKNSLLYLPLARDDLVRELPPNTVAHDHVNALMEHLLLSRIKGGDLERSNLADIHARLQQDTAKLPINTRQKVDNLVQHAERIDQLERSIPSLVQQLTSPAYNAGLTESYRHYFDHQQKRAAVYRFFLLVAALALLVYAIRALVRLREQSNHLTLAASVFETASEGITITDHRGRILNVNAAFTRLTGYERNEVIGKNPRVLNSGRQDAAFYKTMWQSIIDTGHWQGEIWNRRKSGEIYPEWLTINTATNQTGGKKRVTHYVATFSDISQRKKDEAEIYQLAFYDPLTALPNRRLLTDRLRQLLASRGHTIGQAAILFIDIDNFKALNEVRGNRMGDLLLMEVAKRLLACSREGDTVARLGSDEFVVLLQDLRLGAENAASQAKAAGEKIRNVLNQPYWLDNFAYTCSCSVGISLSSAAINAEELLQHANTAMSEAKAAGRNTLRFFDPAMQAGLEARATLEADFRQALAKQQFVLYYQIQVDAHGQPVGAEALVRWIHPLSGLISPAAFSPLAEETGLILPLGHWILEAACAQLKTWEANPSTRDLVLAINVSARQLGAEEFVSQVEAALHDSGIEPARLKLEITESMLLSDVEKVISTMRQLKTLGVSFSMDDFGTGYSSLQYLKRLPLDQIKIDQSFVRDIVASKSDQAIVRTIIAMAHSLNLSIIAEGVETQAQRLMLAEKGCTSFQGYLFSKPIPIDAFEAGLNPALL